MLLASGIGSLLPVLIALACPLLMVLMMRGMHGGAHRGGSHGRTHGSDHFHKSLDELKHERDDLDEQIARRAEANVHANR